MDNVDLMNENIDDASDIRGLPIKTQPKDFEMYEGTDRLINII